LLLDLDGTLIGPSGQPHPRTKAVLQRLIASEAYVMIATGRSEAGTRGVLADLGLEFPAVVFNGAAVYCPKRDRLIEERTLADQTVARVLAFTRERDMPVVVMGAGAKWAREPKSETERRALRGLEDLNLVAQDELPVERLIRITAFSDAYTDSAALAADLAGAVARPVYYTDFPLSALYEHAGSPYQVVDVQPPCRGKGEALRYLDEVHGVAASQVVAVGDATNDIPMFERAGLAVAMRDAMAAAAAVADRSIGGAETDTIAELVEELFPSYLT
jgi:hydroxymethylpyrimidine pyrophosphatase-like HAD family hydrolase